MAPPRKKAARRPAAPRQQPRQPGRSGNPARRAAPGRAGADRNAGRPLPPGNSFYTPNAPPLRRSIERASAPLLVLFHRLPRPVFGLLPLVLLALGALVPIVPLALVFLALDLVLLIWLGFLSWPRIEGLQRVLRVVVPLVVVAIAVVRISRG